MFINKIIHKPGSYLFQIFNAEQNINEYNF